MGMTYERSLELIHGFTNEDDTQLIHFTGTVSGLAVDANGMYRIIADQSCLYDVSTTESATASGCYLPADTVEYVGINDTDGLVLSAVQKSTPGTLWLSKMTASKRFVK